MRLLFVENHAAFARIVCQQFLSAHDVVIVPSVAEARRALGGPAFDAALVDFDLDDGKGTEVVQHLREIGFDGTVLAVSSHDAGNQALLDAGAAGVCKKLHFSRIDQALAAPAATRRPGLTAADFAALALALEPLGWRQVGEMLHSPSGDDVFSLSYFLGRGSWEGLLEVECRRRLRCWKSRESDNQPGLAARMKRYDSLLAAITALREWA